MRICNECKRELPIENFSKSRFPYRHYKCKDCIRAYYSKWYERQGRNRSIDYKEAIAEWRINHPEMVRAYSLLNYAIKTKKITKPTFCSNCRKNKRLSAHHVDYKKPYNVLWLCSSCHKLEHNSNKNKIPIDK